MTDFFDFVSTALFIYGAGMVSLLVAAIFVEGFLDE